MLRSCVRCGSSPLVLVRADQMRLNSARSRAPSYFMVQRHARTRSLVSNTPTYNIAQRLASYIARDIFGSQPDQGAESESVDVKELLRVGTGM